MELVQPTQGVPQTHFLDLPLEMMGQIFSYLDFLDIKLLSETCNTLREISWKHLSDISKTRIWNALNNYQVDTFKNSKRIFQNIELMESCTSSEFEFLAKQIKSLPSISLNNILIDVLSFDSLRSKIEILVKLNVKVGNIRLGINLKDHTNEEIAKFCSSFPKINFTFNFKVPSSKANTLNLDELEEFVFDGEEPKISFDHKVRKVRKLSFFNPKTTVDLSCFSNVEQCFVLSASNLDFLKTLMENNGSTLKALVLFRCYWDNLHIPSNCQLKKLKIIHFNGGRSIPVSLENQHNLRCVTFYNLTNDTLDALQDKDFLTTVHLNLNHKSPFTIDTEKFKFLKKVLNFTFATKIFSKPIITAIFENADRMLSMHLEFWEVSEGTDSEDKMCENSRKVLENLRTLNIYGAATGEYILENVGTPNVEACETDCFPNFLFGCQKLRSLYCSKCLSYDQTVEILENLPSLQFFQIKLDRKSLKETFEYILKNIKNVKHFKLEVLKENKFDDSGELLPGENGENEIDKVVEPILDSLQIIWSRWEDLYETTLFSFTAVLV